MPNGNNPDPGVGRDATDLNATLNNFLDVIDDLQSEMTSARELIESSTDLADPPEEADAQTPGNTNGNGTGSTVSEPDALESSVPPGTIVKPEETKERLEDIDKKIEEFMEEELTGVPRSDDRHIKGQIKEWAVKFKKQVVQLIEQRGSLRLKMDKLIQLIEQERVEAEEAEEERKIEEERQKNIKEALDKLVKDLGDAASKVPEAKSEVSSKHSDNSAKLGAALSVLQAARGAAQQAINSANAKAKASRKALRKSKKFKKLEAKRKAMEKILELLKESSISYEAAAEVMLDQVLEKYKRFRDNVKPPPETPSESNGGTTTGEPVETPSSNFPEDAIGDPEEGADDEAGVTPPPG